MRLGLRPTVFQGTPAAESHSNSALANGSSDPPDNPNSAATTPSKAESPAESPATWSKARKLYGNVDKMWERHRHRYEVNPEQVPRLEASGLTFVGKDEKGERMQILELKGASAAYIRPTSPLFDRNSDVMHKQITRSSSACSHTPSSARALSTRPRHSSGLSPRHVAKTFLLNNLKNRYGITVPRTRREPW